MNNNMRSFTNGRRGNGNDNGRYLNSYNRGGGGGGPVPIRHRPTELKIKVSKVPFQATIDELREHFSAHGRVFEVRIDTRDLESTPTGVVFVTYKPYPESVAWMHKVMFHGRPLRLEIVNSSSSSNNNNNNNNFNINQDRIKWSNKVDTLPAESLEIGVFSQPNTFVPEWKTNDQVSFSLDYKRRTILVEFGFQKRHYKVENPFKYVDGEFYIELDVEHDSRARVTFATKFPGKYWSLDEASKPQDKFYWSYNEMWKRRIDLLDRIPHENLRTRALEPTFTDGVEHFGKWTVYRVTFLLDGRLSRFKDVMNHAGEYNLAEKPIDFGKKPLNIGQIGTKYVERRALDFDVLYMVECCVTHNYLHDYNLDQEFFKILKSLPKELAVEIMKTFVSHKTRNYNPLSDLMKMVNHVIPDNVTPPEYCVLMRKVVITPTAMYILLPTMETSNRIIRLFKSHKDRFLRVQFTDEGSSPISSTIGQSNDAIYNRIFRTLQYGIKIGDRHYEFLAFSSSQLREHSCWFFASSDTLTADHIRERMGDFSDIKVVAKYAARMGQCFSSTRAIAHLPVNDIKLIPDVCRNGFTFSDGVGKISPNLSRQIAEKMKLRSTPSAVQFRLGGYKGVLCVSRYLRENQIQVRPSQLKFDSPHCELEIIKGSTFIPAYLNRQAITLLSALGVPDEIFTQMKDEQVRELEKMLLNDHTAMKVLLHNIDEHGISRIMADLVKAGFLHQRDPYLSNLMALFRIMMLKNLKDKAKISVHKGAFLLGVLDETESLKEDQIYICRSDVNNPKHKEVIEGPCIVYRNPCFHPGDIRMVTAVNCPKLDYLVDVLVFSSLGYRDIPNQCSGGDLDGDDYTIIWDERLFPKIKNYTPMEYHAPVPVQVDQVKVEHIRKFFVNYILNDNLGQIANAHLAKADLYENGAFHGSCLRLAQLHSEAVDFPKTGRPAEFPSELRAKMVPDFMDNGHKPTYISKKILGKLYRSIQVNDFNPSTDIVFDQRLYVEGYEKFLDDARAQKRRYDSYVRGLMNQYGIASEYEVVTGFIVNPITKIEKKKPREISKSIMDAMTGIRHQFRDIFNRQFIPEGSNQVSFEEKNSMEAKAYAWYYVTYYAGELGDKPAEYMLSFPWCMHELLCGIAIKNSSRLKSIEELNTPRMHSTAQPPKNPVPKKIIEHDVRLNDDDGGMEKLRQSIRLG